MSNTPHPICPELPEGAIIAHVTPPRKSPFNRFQLCRLSGISGSSTHDVFRSLEQKGFAQGPVVPCFFAVTVIERKYPVATTPMGKDTKREDDPWNDP